jgi:pimeloyl-ACP methyl ester carboxylesterase
MGASLAIMYAARYPKSIVSLILDTPFRNLKKVVRNVA